MFRTVLISTLLAAMLAAGLSAFVQSATAQPAATDAEVAASLNYGPLDEEIARWTRVLDRVEAQLDEDDISLSVLSILDQTVDQVRDQAIAARLPVQRDVDRIGDLIRALGPAPAEGEPPEAESVVTQRRELTGQFSIPQGTLRQLGVLVQRTSLLADRIAETQRIIVTAELLVRTPSLLSYQNWADAAAEFVALGKRILATPRQWFLSPQVSGTVGPVYLAGLLISVISAAGLGWFLRRWLIRQFGRKADDQDPSYRKRVLAAVAEATGTTLIPILIVVVVYAMLLSRGLLFGVFQALMLGVVEAVVWTSILRGLPRAMLAPRMPHWRLTRMGNLAARLWDRRAFTLAVIIGIDLLILNPFLALQPSAALRFTYAFVANGAIAAWFVAVAFDERLWRTPEQEAQTTTTGAAKPTGPQRDEVPARSRWWSVGRVVVAALALALPITALAGFGVLSDHISRRLLASAGIFLIALVLHGLARDLVAVFTREDEKPPESDEAANPIYVWSVLLLDIGLVVSMVFFMLPLWGGHWDTIAERIGLIMSGLQIGGRTFSLTDVLLGMAVFIFLMILVRLFQRFLDVRILRQTRMDVGVRDALKTGIGYGGVVIAALAAINTAGIDLSGLAIIAGALSVGIGFGMQSIVNNFVSGLILLIERPIKVGDWVVVGQDQGFVKRISVRSTQIQTFSNASVILPNSELISGRVTNWMFKDRSGRVEIPIGVAYGSDTAKVRETLLACVRGRPGIKPWPAPEVVFIDFGDSALIFHLRFHIGNILERIVIASDVRFAIDAAFREAGITIPFPQRDVHMIQPGPETTTLQPRQDDPAEPPSGKASPIRAGRHGDDIDTGQETDT